MKRYKRFTSILLTHLLLAIVLISCTKTAVNVRDKIDFNENWRFELQDSPDFKLAHFNDELWRKLDLPHDWSIEGKFNETNPAGVGGGALPGGVGWYRKSFSLPAIDSVRRIYITFDGVYQNSEVYVNGKFLGKRPNGYISFQYDLTPFLHYGEEPNTIAVRVDNSDQPNSRWYSGSGIYRNVWLTKTNPVHIDLWGTHITTPSVTEENASIEVEVNIKNTTTSEKELVIETQILDGNNKVITKTENKFNVQADGNNAIMQKLEVETPTLWSIENPYLYKAVNIVKYNNKTIDVYETSFGIRYFEFHAKKGFSLNGKKVKIRGVCNHHDLGALGAAINTRALERQLEILKEMGCNGIRTSHNPPAPELLELCDKMGFIVQNETFDVWAKSKVENDYATYWDKWHVQDLTDHLKRDRNHASVFSWSIGNEILEQWDTSGVRIAHELKSIVEELSPGMPVTSGCNDPQPSNYIIKSGALDLIGFNYHHEWFESFADSFPNQKFIATETVSSLNSRGEYNMPSDSVYNWPVRWDIPFYDGMPGNKCSAYDNTCAPWGSTHMTTLKLMEKHDFLSGMYIWTGFDYIGEPTPYGWPSRSSYFGIIDLAGFPKDIYYMYQSVWTNKDVLHILPHWNWEEGQTIDVVAYTNYDEVELFINDKSQGVKSLQNDDLHLMWRVTYQPGTVKAVGKNKSGETKEVIIKTAGAPAKINLIADRSEINANGKDLSFVTVEILDKDGNLVPNADNKVEFSVNDMVKVEAVDNGSQTSHESFKASYRKAFNGKCLVIVKSLKTTGKALLTATSDNLESAEIELIVK